MLDAACAGQIFTSPTPDQMLEAHQGGRLGRRRLAHREELHGDVINFEMAAELAAAETGITVDAVVVNDDVAVQDSPLYGRAARGRSHRLAREARRCCRRGRSLTDRSCGPGPAVNDGGRSMGWRSPCAPCRPQVSRHSSLPKTRWRSASASTASPVVVACHLRIAREIAEQLMEPILADLDFTPGPVIVMLQWDGRYTAHRAVSRCTAKSSRSSPRKPASRWLAISSETTSHRSRWPVARSLCCRRTRIDQAVGCPREHCRTAVGDIGPCQTP